jgi:hypothetical protein
MPSDTSSNTRRSFTVDRFDTRIPRILSGELNESERFMVDELAKKLLAQDPSACTIEYLEDVVARRTAYMAARKLDGKLCTIHWALGVVAAREAIARKRAGAGDVPREPE